MPRHSASFAPSSKKHEPVKFQPGVTKLSWEKLAAHLRKELEELGGLIRLIELRHMHTVQSDPARLRRVAVALKRQARLARISRLQRKKAQQRFIRANGLPPHATAWRLLQAVPTAPRLLVQALLKEIDHVERRIRRFNYDAGALKKVDRPAARI